MTLVQEFGAGAIWFSRSVAGLVVRPYETYRRIVEHGHPVEFLYVSGLVVIYFALATLVRIASFRPLLLTRQFVVLLSAAAATYLLVVGLMWVFGRIVGGKGEFRAVALAWGYSLIPTVLWFLATSLLYVLLPPPRTTSSLGFLFSGVYLVFTSTLFFWKAMLAYLTLRFSLKLDLLRILAVCAIITPIVSVYSVGLYWLGIFRVPFV